MCHLVCLCLCLILTHIFWSKVLQIHIPNSRLVNKVNPSCLPHSNGNHSAPSNFDSPRVPAMNTGCKEVGSQLPSGGETQGCSPTIEDAVLGTLRGTMYWTSAEQSGCRDHRRHRVEMASKWEAQVHTALVYLKQNCTEEKQWAGAKSNQVLQTSVCASSLTGLCRGCSQSALHNVSNGAGDQ